MDHLDDKTQQFVERMGLMMERSGAARTFGRLMGLLLVADEPISLDTMARLLHVSKASISTNTRHLEQGGFAQRVSIPGDRRTYYEITPNSFEHMLSARMKMLHEFVGLFEEGLQAIEDENHAAHARLMGMRDFYQFIAEDIVEMMARWKKQQKNKASST